VRGGVEIETTMSVGEGPSSGRPLAPGIKENQNVKRCRRWIHTCAGEMAAKRETTMRAREGPSGGDVNLMPDKSPQLDPLEFRRGAKQWQGGACRRGGLPHICEHKCLATTKRGQASGEEGVEDLISNSGNDDDGEASFSESHCLFTCSIDGA
jgi:hypothetical protein